MNIKIWLLVVIIIAALVIGFFIGKNVKVTPVETVTPPVPAPEPSKGMKATAPTDKKA